MAHAFLLGKITIIRCVYMLFFVFKKQVVLQHICFFIKHKRKSECTFNLFRITQSFHGKTKTILTKLA